eukprot:364542-Chlamydomonas_euryale.AAC.9
MCSAQVGGASLRAACAAAAAASAASAARHRACSRANMLPMAGRAEATLRAPATHPPLSPPPPPLPEAGSVAGATPMAAPAPLLCRLPLAEMSSPSPGTSVSAAGVAAGGRNDAPPPPPPPPPMSLPLPPPPPPPPTAAVLAMAAGAAAAAAVRARITEASAMAPSSNSWTAGLQQLGRLVWFHPCCTGATRLWGPVGAQACSSSGQLAQRQFESACTYHMRHMQFESACTEAAWVSLDRGSPAGGWPSARARPRGSCAPGPSSRSGAG